MTCESAGNLVESYLDDELEPGLGAQVREHLATCRACAETHGRHLQLRSDIRAQAPYHRAPPHLRNRITIALRGADRRTAAHWQWIALAASLFLAVSLAWNIVLVSSRGSGSSTAARDIVTGHVRSLMGTHLTDVASSDRHTVKPWFNGKLDFSPDVKDFAAEGFPLLGGRLDYVDGHPAAALVYQHRLHIINVFTWPSAPSSQRSELTSNGYRAIHWNNAGMTFWAVSDLSAAELTRFASLYQR